MTGVLTRAPSPRRLVGGEASLAGSDDLVVMPMVNERGALRMIVPGFRLEYDCPTHGASEATSMGHAVLDTGAPWTVMPRRALPSHHLTWDDLPERGGGTARLQHGGVEYRWWEVRVSVMGIAVSTRIKVLADDTSALDFPILGVEDFGRQFTFAADFGADPPRWAMQRRGSKGLALSQVDEPFNFDDLVLLRYVDQAFVVPRPNTLPAIADAPDGVKELVRFGAVMVDINSPDDIPRLFVGPAAMRRLDDLLPDRRLLP